MIPHIPDEGQEGHLFTAFSTGTVVEQALRESRVCAIKCGPETLRQQRPALTNNERMEFAVALIPDTGENRPAQAPCESEVRREP